MGADVKAVALCKIQSPLVRPSFRTSESVRVNLSWAAVSFKEISWIGNSFCQEKYGKIQGHVKVNRIHRLSQGKVAVKLCTAPEPVPGHPAEKWDRMNVSFQYQ
jgi:hypothetical protein